MGRRKEYKRYTFFVSPDLTNKTFRYQVVYRQRFSTFKNVLDAFSIEPLTKEFYREIANWYFWALKHVEFPEGVNSQPGGKNTALIRFLARIIFIWFMKRRGLVPDKLFDREYLKNVVKDIDDDDASTYYKAILQNLFFATLSCEPDKRRFAEDAKWFGKGKGGSKDFGNQYAYRYKELFKISEKEVLKLFRDVPFLNGGLFEMLDNKDEGIYIDGFTRRKKYQPVFPNFLFFSDEREVDLSEYYDEETKGQHRRDKVRGLIHILNSYNFTIDENSPVDEEIALDPELLGKVFENLLASYNDETGTTARKASGSYYTPRDIVDYMVDRSLKEYFKTAVPDIAEEKLDKLFSYSEEGNPFDEQTTERLIDAIYKLKVIDPAVGSGAFPMGMLHKLVFLLRKLDPEGKQWMEMQLKALENVKDPKLRSKWKKDIKESFKKGDLDYGRKLYLIQNVIYGVDIQPIAVQIAKLRFFISLLVDEHIDDSAPNKGIKPLPNLETKFVAANTLYKLDEPPYNLLLHRVKGMLDELFKVRQEIFATYSHEEKKKLIKKDREIRARIVEELKNFWGSEHSDALTKLANWDPYDIRQSADWFDPLWMFGVKDGFDIVIGNPPYVSHVNMTDEIKEYMKRNYKEFHVTRADLYVYFYARGYELLKERGILAYITSNKWMRAAYGKKLRKFLSENATILEIIDFTGYPVFAQTVDTNIIILRKEEPPQGHKIQFVVVTTPDIDNILAYLSEHKKEMLQKYLSEDIFLLVEDRVWAIKEKVEKAGKPLGKWGVKIYFGIKTGYNAAFIIDCDTRRQILDACRTEEERRRTEEIIKPVLRGRDIHRWGYKWAGKWLIVIEKGWTNRNRGSMDAEEFFRQQFPALYEYFMQFAERPSRGKGLFHRDDQGDYWWELRECTYYNEFEREKIVFQRIVKAPKFAYDICNVYIEATGYIVTGSDLKYILPILNSKLTYKLFYVFYSGGGVDGEIKIYKLLKLPIPRCPVNSRRYKQLVSLVDRILQIAGPDCSKISCEKLHDQSEPAPTAREEIKRLEAQIDDIVRELYGLTREEVELIEKVLGGGETGDA